MTSYTAEAPGPKTEAAVRGRRLAVVSLLMVPANLPWLAAVGTAAMHLLGAEDGHLLTEYGAGGWVALVLVLGFMAIPSIVGVILGCGRATRATKVLAPPASSQTRWSAWA